MPTIGDMYTKDIEVLGAPRHIEIDDTAGQVCIQHKAYVCVISFSQLLLWRRSNIILLKLWLLYVYIWCIAGSLC